MSKLNLYLLGTPRIEIDGQPVSISRRKALALFAYLALTGHSHSRDALATLLWPENDQSSARALLTPQHLHDQPQSGISMVSNGLGNGWIESRTEWIDRGRIVVRCY